MCSRKSSGNRTLSDQPGRLLNGIELLEGGKHCSGDGCQAQYWNVLFGSPSPSKRLSMSEILILGSSNLVVPSSFQHVDSSCSNLILNFDFQSTFVEFSWFHVYPFSFTIWSRHKKQRQL